jgi:hypothetical protein
MSANLKLISQFNVMSAGDLLCAYDDSDLRTETALFEFSSCLARNVVYQTALFVYFLLNGMGSHKTGKNALAGVNVELCPA